MYCVQSQIYRQITSGGQYRHATWILLLHFSPSGFSPRSVLCLSPNFRLQSFEVIVLLCRQIRWADFKCALHALGHADFHWRDSRLHTRIFVFSNAVLSTASPLYNTLCGRGRSYKTRSLDCNTACCGMQAESHFSPTFYWCPPLDTTASFL